MTSLAERKAKMGSRKPEDRPPSGSTLREAAERAASGAVERQMTGIQEGIADIAQKLGAAIARMERLQQQADTLGDELAVLRRRVQCHEEACQADMAVVREQTVALEASHESIRDDVLVLSEIVTTGCDSP